MSERFELGDEALGGLLWVAFAEVVAAEVVVELAGGEGEVEAAVLEGVLVALDRVLAPGDLLGKRCAPFAELRAVGFVADGGLRDCVADESSVSVEPGELVEDRGLQSVLW